MLALHWKISNIAPFIDHSVYIIFKVENVLNLACSFLFDTSCPNSMIKTYLSLNFGYSAREAYCIFNVQSVLILDCWFYFATSYPNSTCKMFLFSKFQVFCKRSIDIDKAPWKMVWILVDFDLSLLTRIPHVKHTNCENSRSAAKKASILLLSWNRLSIISSKWQISWILFDWSLFATTFKCTSKTHLLWQFLVLRERRVSISIYLAKFSLLQVCKRERT